MVMVKYGNIESVNRRVYEKWTLFVISTKTSLEYNYSLHYVQQTHCLIWFYSSIKNNLCAVLIPELASNTVCEAD